MKRTQYAKCHQHTARARRTKHKFLVGASFDLRTIVSEVIQLLEASAWLANHPGPQDVPRMCEMWKVSGIRLERLEDARAISSAARKVARFERKGERQCLH